MMRWIDREEVIRKEKENKAGSGTTAKSIAKILGNIVFGLMVAIVAVLVFSLVYVKMSGGPPTVVGHRMYIVLSGSMSPAFETGSLAFVKPTAPADIKSGDIITYRGLGDQEQFVSHRVLEVNKDGGQISFTTKGDANEAVDPNPVAGENLVGRVSLAIPYLGYFMEYSKTKQGIFLLVIIPASILLLYESVSLLRQMRAKGKEKAVQCESQREEGGGIGT